MEELDLEDVIEDVVGALVGAAVYRVNAVICVEVSVITSTFSNAESSSRKKLANSRSYIPEPVAVEGGE